jgi:hypothetical protein
MDPTLDEDGDTIMTDAPPLSRPSTPLANPWNTRSNFDTVVRNSRFNLPSVASSSPNADNCQLGSVQPRPRAPRRLGMSVGMNHSGNSVDNAPQTGCGRLRAAEATDSDMSRQRNGRSMVYTPGRSHQYDQQGQSDNLGAQVTAERLPKCEEEEGNEMLPPDYFFNCSFHPIRGVRPPPDRVNRRGRRNGT